MGGAETGRLGSSGEDGRLGSRMGSRIGRWESVGERVGAGLAGGRRAGTRGPSSWGRMSRAAGQGGGSGCGGSRQLTGEQRKQGSRWRAGRSTREAKPRGRRAELMSRGGRAEGIQIGRERRVTLRGRGGGNGSGGMEEE